MTTAGTGDLAVAVVIATAGRETRLRFALEALAIQTLRPDRFEVVVVRAPAASPALASAPERLRVRFLTARSRSRPAQRNAGWQAARAPLVAFTDDDCRPAPTWLEAMVSAAAPDAVVQGRTQPDPDEVHLLHALARSMRVDGPSPWFETANIAYPRALLERLGGFDEAFEASGEDTDLGLRALAAGAELRYEPAALVWHAVVGRPPWQAIGDGWRRWQTTPLIYKRHPLHRAHLVGGVFYNRRHAALVPLLAGVPLVRRRPALAAAAALPWALDGVDRRNLGAWRLVRHGLHLPARLAADVAQLAGVVRGAIRHRALVI